MEGTLGISLTVKVFGAEILIGAGSAAPDRNDVTCDCCFGFLAPAPKDWSRWGGAKGLWRSRGLGAMVGPGSFGADPSDGGGFAMGG